MFAPDIPPRSSATPTTRGASGGSGTTARTTADQLTRLSDITHRFAESRHFEIKAGDYSKAGRPVLNRIIEINKETFFKYGNFRNEGIVELVAYSHEAKEVWNPLWDELISAISAAFGDNVTRVEKR